MTLIAKPLFSLLLMMLAGLPFVIAIAVTQRVRSSRLVRRSLEAQGLLVRRMELRFFTRGPFSEMRSLPGFKHSDTLYRVLAEDQAGRSHVLWARIPSRMPWNVPRCETRPDAAPGRTRLGLGALAFYILVAFLTAGMLVFIVSVSVGRAFGATPAPPDGPAGAPTITSRTAWVRTS
jgi:hypothetical protein